MKTRISKYFSGDALRLVALGVTILSASMFLSACGKQINVHGQVLSQQRIDALRVGIDDKETVMRILGSPSALGTFADNRWYYVTTKTQDEALNPNILLERQILIVDFDEDGTLASVYKKTEDDGKAIEPIGRTTPTYGQSLGVVDQLMQYLGRGF